MTEEEEMLREHMRSYWKAIVALRDERIHALELYIEELEEELRAREEQVA